MRQVLLKDPIMEAQLEDESKRRRMSFTKEQKRQMAEQTTAAACAEAERQRLIRQEKSRRLKELRLHATSSSPAGTNLDA